MATIIETQETVRELQERLRAMQAETGVSWGQIADESGIPAGTLTQWKAGKYAGDNEKYAGLVRRYLDGRAELAAIKSSLVLSPGYLPTQSSQRMFGLLQLAHTGKIVAISATPGCGKTMTAQEYATRAPNVWIVTGTPSASGLQGMLVETLIAMGVTSPSGPPQMLSHQVRAKLRNANGLLIYDEAQELVERALDEIRSWHDATGVGVVLMGDERVIGRLGGRRRVQLARLHSRIEQFYTQSGPSRLDVETLARGWGVTAKPQIDFLRSLSNRPGALRGIAGVISKASNLAAAEERGLLLSDLQEVWTQSNSDLSVAASA